jgi:hypothetical protein
MLSALMPDHHHQPDLHRQRATRTMEHNTATDTAALLAKINTAMAAYTASIDRGLALAKINTAMGLALAKINTAMAAYTASIDRGLALAKINTAMVEIDDA